MHSDSGGTFFMKVVRLPAIRSKHPRFSIQATVRYWYDSDNASENRIIKARESIGRKDCRSWKSVLTSPFSESYDCGVIQVGLRLACLLIN